MGPDAEVSRAGLRVVVAEDSVVLRHGLVELLTSYGHQVVDAVGDAVSLPEAVDRHRPDLVVVDIRMPPTHTTEGLRAAVRLRQEHPGLGILVFSQYVETHHAAQLLAAGAQGTGYLLKDRIADVRDFLDALTRVAAGGTVLDPEVVNQIFAASRRGDDLGALTARERQVLALMSEGRSNGAVAATLAISPASVEKNITNIFAKLGLPPCGDDHRRVLAVLRFLGAD